MYRWLNPSHPRTMQGAVMLGYLTAVFSLLGGAVALLLPAIAVGAGAFGTANDKRIGWFALIGGSGLMLALDLLLVFLQIASGSIVGTLITFNSSIFTGAVFLLAIHRHSREYQQIWFS